MNKKPTCCSCGYPCDYVGLYTVEGCTNPDCQFYQEVDTIPCPMPDWFGASQEMQDFIDYLNGMDNDSAD